MSTPNSSTPTAYCTAQQFLQRYDVRSVGQFLSDGEGALPPAVVLANGAFIGGSISAATSTTPIQVTSNGHGLSTNDSVTIGGGQGLTVMNGGWTITVVDSNNFALNGSNGFGFPTPYQAATPATWTKNLKLADALREASGWVESACLMANRYQPTDLQMLTGASAQLLVGMVAGITMFFIWDRRPSKFENSQLPLKAQIALDQLDQLREGQMIFGLVEAQNAGNPDAEFMSASEINLRNFSSVGAKRYYGDRQQFFVPGTG